MGEVQKRIHKEWQSPPIEVDMVLAIDWGRHQAWKKRDRYPFHFKFGRSLAMDYKASCRCSFAVGAISMR